MDWSSFRAFTLPAALALPGFIIVVLLIPAISLHAQEATKGGAWDTYSRYDWGLYGKQYERVMYLNGVPDRVADGYTGNVQRVIVSVAYYDEGRQVWVDSGKVGEATLSKSKGYLLYDQRGNRLVDSTYPALLPGNDIKWNYDSSGRLVSYYDKLYARSCEFTHDAQGRIMQEVRGKSLMVRYLYNAKGKLEKRLEYGATSKDDNGGTWYIYDKSGRVAQIVDYALRSDSYKVTAIKYDTKGNLTAIEEYGVNKERDKSPGAVKVKDAYSRSSQQSIYNKQGKIVERSEPLSNGMQQNQETWQYDAQGNLLSRRIENDGAYNPRIFKYELDAHGNWIVATQYGVTYKFGEEVLVPSRQFRRDIQYYE